MVDCSSMWGLGRGRVRNNPQPKRLSEVFADIVTGKHLRDVKMMMVGHQGSGKSRSLLFLACECAKEIAKRVGGSPEDYFPSDLSNVVIGSPEGHAGLFQNMKKYSILILDDSGVSLNSRSFMTSYNRSMNDCFQTMRPNRSIVLISTPDTMTTDIIIRTMVSHYAEVSESFHGHGYNLIKVFQVHRKYREGKTHYHYYQSGNQAIVRHKFGNPPGAIVDTYEQKRLEATMEIASRAGKAKERKSIEIYPDRLCGKCGYSWTPKTSNPKKCPHCNNILLHQEPANV